MHIEGDGTPRAARAMAVLEVLIELAYQPPVTTLY